MTGLSSTMPPARGHLAALSTTSATSKPLEILATTSPSHLETEFDETDDDTSSTGTSNSSPPATSPVSQRHHEHGISQYPGYDLPNDFHPFKKAAPCDDVLKQSLGAELPAVSARPRTPSAISLAILNNASDKTKPCELMPQHATVTSTGSAQDDFTTLATAPNGSCNVIDTDRPQLTGRSTTYTHAHRPPFISTASNSRKQSSNSIMSASPALLSPLLSSLPNRLNFFKDNSTRSQNMSPTSPQSPQVGLKMMNDGARKVTGLEAGSRPQAIRKGSGASFSYRSRADQDDSGVEKANVYTSCGRHGDDWLFGGFSLGGTVKKMWDVRMEGRAESTRPN